MTVMHGGVSLYDQIWIRDGSDDEDEDDMEIETSAAWRLANATIESHSTSTPTAPTHMASVPHVHTLPPRKRPRSPRSVSSSDDEDDDLEHPSTASEADSSGMSSNDSRRAHGICKPITMPSMPMKIVHPSIILPSTPNAAPPPTAPPDVKKKRRFASDILDPAAEIVAFVEHHGHLPRYRLKKGSAPFLLGERLLGTMLAACREGDHWTKPSWFRGSLAQWDEFGAHLERCPTKQQLASRQTVMDNIRTWCEAAALVGCTPSTSIPLSVNKTNIEAMAAWALASRAQRLLCNVANGQFYPELMEPAMKMAEGILGAKYPDIVAHLKEKLQGALLKKPERVTKRRISRVARNEKAKENRDKADNQLVLGHGLEPVD